MGLINITNLEDGQFAVANELNQRFGTIADTLNGNIDTQNLANNAVTRERIAPGAVTADKIETGSILPSKVGSTWVGKTDGKNSVTTSYATVFNKVITLAESAYIYVLWTAGANANNTTVDPEIRILVNDVVIESFSGINGLELLTAKVNADFPFVASGITDNKMSGNVNVKIQAKSSNANGWDLNNGFARIDALGDGTYLG